MSGKLRVLVSAILLAPAAAMGLGLGEIRLSSALNEPFSAEIDLVAATPEELAALDAHLASQEVFTRYGLDRPSFLSSLEFNVGRGQDGRNVLLVRSRDAISEPFVSFLIDVNWPRGRLLREYTVLLDPPAMLAAEDSPAPAPVAAPTTMPAAPPQQPSAPAPLPAPDHSSWIRSGRKLGGGPRRFTLEGFVLPGKEEEADSSGASGAFRTEDPSSFSGLRG